MENIPFVDQQLIKLTNKIVHHHPNTIFGGSLGLVTLGLLKRNVGDLDIITYKDQPEIKKYLKTQCAEDIFGPSVSKFSLIKRKTMEEAYDQARGVRRDALIIDGIKVCHFEVIDDRIPPPVYKKYGILFENPVNAVLAKLEYIDNYKKNDLTPPAKHVNDIIEIHQNSLKQWSILQDDQKLLIDPVIERIEDYFRRAVCTKEQIKDNLPW